MGALSAPPQPSEQRPARAPGYPWRAATRVLQPALGRHLVVIDAAPMCAVVGSARVGELITERVVSSAQAAPPLQKLRIALADGASRPRIRSRVLELAGLHQPCRRRRGRKCERHHSGACKNPSLHVTSLQRLRLRIRPAALGGIFAGQSNGWRCAGAPGSRFGRKISRSVPVAVRGVPRLTRPWRGCAREEYRRQEREWERWSRC